MKPVSYYLKVGLTALAIGFLIGALAVCRPDPPTPPDPPAPVPSVAVFAGVYDLLGATGDIEAFLDDCVAAGAAGIRIFVCYSWNSAQPISPYVQVGTWTHDNGITFPLYRLAAWNPEFWDYFAAILRACKARGLICWVVAEDYCSLKGNSSQKYWNPFYCSEEALGPTTPGGVWGAAMKPLHSALYAKIASTLAAVGVEYLFEPMNEFEIVDGTDAEEIAWHGWAVDEIKALGIPESKIIASSGAPAAAIAAQVGIFSPHGIGRPDQIKRISGVEESKTLFSSDGYWTGTGPADIKGRRGPGMDVAAAIGQAILYLKARGFEYLPRDAYAMNNDRADVSSLDLSTVKAIAFAK